MRISVFSFKGGCTKTHISVLLAELLQTKNREVGIITNDCYTPLETKLDKNKLLKCGMNEEIPISNDDDFVIYDLGGRADDKVVNVLKHSDLVIVPTIPELIFLHSHIASIQEISQINKNILQVVNRTRAGDFQKIKLRLEEVGIHYPCVEIPETRLINNLFNKSKCTIKSQLEKYHYNKKAQKNIKFIFDFVQAVKDNLGIK